MSLTSFNAAPADQAHAAMLECCGSARFADALTAGRPYPSQAAAEQAAKAAFAALNWDDVREAVDRHPRIGARATGVSAAEQAGVADESRAALAAGNAEYEQRFGHVFLICATGLSGDQMLAALRQRLGHDESSERTAVSAELEKITVLRLRKALTE